MAGMHARYAELRAMVSAALDRWVAACDAGTIPEARLLLPLPPALEAAVAGDTITVLAPAAQVRKRCRFRALQEHCWLTWLSDIVYGALAELRRGRKA